MGFLCFNLVVGLIFWVMCCNEVLLLYLVVVNGIGFSVILFGVVIDWFVCGKFVLVLKILIVVLVSVFIGFEVVVFIVGYVLYLIGYVGIKVWLVYGLLFIVVGVVCVFVLVFV